MTSFFDKLNTKLNGKLKAALQAAGASSGTAAPVDSAASADDGIGQAQSLNIDIYQSPNEIVIYAAAAGVDPASFDITLDEENDVLTIRGAKKRPEKGEKVNEATKEPEGKFVREECSWEPFFRKVVLPTDVDVVAASAVLTKGVLVVSLPILKVAEGRKLKVVEAPAAKSA